MRKVVDEPAIFYSREGLPLNGWICGFEKGEVFEVHPLYQGMTHEERMGWAESFGRQKLRRGYDRWWQMTLRRNIPDWQEIMPLLAH